MGATRGLAVVFFAALTPPYLAGLAMGGVKWSVNPQVNSWLFMAEMAVGGYTTGFYFLANALADRPEYVAYFPSSDVAQIYLATAGLLNVLAILDAIARAQTAGLPVFYHEIVARQRREEEQA